MSRIKRFKNACVITKYFKPSTVAGKRDCFANSTWKSRQTLAYRSNKRRTFSPFLNALLSQIYRNMRPSVRGARKCRTFGHNLPFSTVHLKVHLRRKYFNRYHVTARKIILTKCRAPVRYKIPVSLYTRLNSCMRIEQVAKFPTYVLRL